MALPKTKVPIRNKLKKNIFAKSWCRGASIGWKIDYYDKKELKKNKNKQLEEGGC